MEIIADASAFLAVVLNENEREWVIEKTTRCSLTAPEVLPYEIGNALIAVRKRGRLDDQAVLHAFDLSQRITVSLVPVSIDAAMRIAIQCNIYAYDAYYLQCCIEKKAPLLTLDDQMRDAAKSLRIKVVE